MKKFLIIFIIIGTIFIYIPTSFASTKITTPNFTIFWDISPQTTQINYVGYSIIYITTPNSSTYFSSSSNNEVINIHELHCVPYNINSDNFLNQWENNLKNKYNNIIYTEKIPIKNGIIYILIDDYGNKEVRTHYYKNGTVYTTCTYFKDPKVTLNKLKTFSYKAIESIYPF